MIDPNARSVIPLIDISKGGDSKKVMNSFYNTLKVLENMNLALEFFKMYVIAWREDTAYGVALYDDTGLFILPLPTDVCRVVGAYKTGDLSYAVDMSYFTNKQEMLEWIPEPFNTMYNEYQKDTRNGRWQVMPDEYCVCLKVNIEDTEIPLPPFMSVFNSLIGLSDMEDIQAVADAQQIYKLITATIPTLSGADNPDEWAVDVTTALKYFDKMVASLPDYIGAVLSPIPLDTIAFDNDQSTDINKIEKATQTLLNSAGGSQILNSSTITSAVAQKAAIICDSKFATASLRPQTEGWLNRFLTYHVSNPAKIRLLDVTPFTREDVKKSMMENLQYGYPNILAINTLNGYTELETLSLNFLEQDCLNLTSKFIPLQSAHTMSGDKESGGQIKDIDDLSDAGVDNIEKRDRKQS